tara:strand:- start:12804 stop:14459 length:1656 start_codon:yes stop_codon:yes gene_type:complete
MTERYIVSNSFLIGIISAALSVCIGLVVIVGWYVELPSLIQILPSFAPMQFNTALCFLLSGIGLTLLTLRKTTSAFWLGIAVFIFALVTLLQYPIGVDIGLDNLFMEPYIVTKTSHPGRMAPNTALCFLVFGLALLLESFRTRSTKQFCEGLYIPEFLSPLIIALATMSLFGYIFNNDTAIAWANLTAMALHTTIGLIVLGIGLSFVIWSQHANKEIRRGFWLSVLLLFSCLALDISQPLGVAAGVAYAPLVFCSYWFKGKFTSFTFAAIATVLTVIGYFTSPEGLVQASDAIFNRFLSVVAIWITALALYSRKVSEERLETSQLALQNSIKEVEQFTYIASHDLRAPLRAIDNLTQWLEEDLNDVLKDDTRENMNLLRGRVKRLDKLLDDILRFTRAGRTGQKLIQVDTKILLSNINDLTYLSDKFRLEVKGKMPAVNAADGTLEVIFANLINNAINHHDKDSGVICIDVQQREKEWVFRVIDDGPGIPDEYAEKIFEMFKTLEGRDTAEGSGMGLSIVRKLVNLNNGNIWVEKNILGQGACFCFSWPKI